MSKAADEDAQGLNIRTTRELNTSLQKICITYRYRKWVYGDAVCRGAIEY